jgi:xanthine dehydrogenase accessory factor
MRRDDPNLRGAAGLVTGLFQTLADALRAEQPAALAEIIEGPPELLGGKLLVLPGQPTSVLGSVGDPDLDRVITRDAEGELAAGLTVTRHYGRHGEARARDISVFIESFAPPPRMIIFGAVDFTAALARVAKILGYRVTVCDARPVFATRARFPMADEVVVSWPDKYLAEVGDSLRPRDAVCVLTHDPKFDVPAIVAALRTQVGYLGAMGSRRTHDDRTARLIAAGVAAESLGRVMGPIGLDIGARTPEETAVAICAEIIAMRTGRDAPSLRDREGPIHRDLALARELD